MVPRFLGERYRSVFQAGLETLCSRIEAQWGMPGVGTAARHLHLSSWESLLGVETLRRAPGQTSAFSQGAGQGGKDRGR